MVGKGSCVPAETAFPDLRRDLLPDARFEDRRLFFGAVPGSFSWVSGAFSPATISSPRIEVRQADSARGSAWVNGSGAPSLRILSPKRPSRPRVALRVSTTSREQEVIQGISKEL